LDVVVILYPLSFPFSSTFFNPKVSAVASLYSFVSLDPVASQ